MRRKVLIAATVIAIVLGLGFGIAGVSMLTGPQPAQAETIRVCLHGFNPTPVPGRGGTPVPFEYWIIKYPATYQIAVQTVIENPGSFIMAPWETCPR